MYAIEFQTKIKNGMIEVPSQYKDKLSETVRVIILTEASDSADNLIDHLLTSPLKIKDFTPLTRTAIYERE